MARTISGKKSKTQLCKQLKANTVIMESTFSKANLQVLSYAIRPEYDDDDYDYMDFEILLELAAFDGETIGDDVRIKVNLYDADGDIYDTCNADLNAQDFENYAVYRIACYVGDSEGLKLIRGARVYAAVIRPAKDEDEDEDIGELLAQAFNGE